MDSLEVGMGEEELSSNRQTLVGETGVDHCGDL